MTTKFIAVFSLAAIAAAIFAAGIYAGDALPSDWLTGTWRGAMQSNGRQIGVTLTADLSAPGKNTLRFSQPWACQLAFADGVQEGEATTFALKGFGAGRCRTYQDGSIKVRQRGGGVLFVELKSRSDASNTVQFSLSKIDAASKAAPQPLKTEKAQKARAE